MTSKRCRHGVCGNRSTSGVALGDLYGFSSMLASVANGSVPV
jgi:hypothetical protein